MNVSLTVMGGKHNGRVIPVNVPEFRIGRDRQCHLRPNSPDVSRFHCAIVRRPGGVFIKDFGSKNGTIVNQRVLVGGELQLQDGDVIEVGRLAFLVTIELPAAVAEEPAAEAADVTPVAPGESQVIDVLGSASEPTGEETVMIQTEAITGAPPATQRPPDSGPIWLETTP